MRLRFVVPTTAGAINPSFVTARLGGDLGSLESNNANDNVFSDTAIPVA